MRQKNFVGQHIVISMYTKKIWVSHSFLAESCKEGEGNYGLKNKKFHYCYILTRISSDKKNFLFDSNFNVFIVTRSNHYKIYIIILKDVQEKLNT